MKPILAPEGKFTEAQLDNYLEDFEIIEEVYEEGLLSEAQLCMFSYYVTLTANNKEISDYIKKNTTSTGQFIETILYRIP